MPGRRKRLPAHAPRVRQRLAGFGDTFERFGRQHGQRRQQQGGEEGEGGFHVFVEGTDSNLGNIG